MSTEVERRRIRFQVQPTVSHYREPLIRCLAGSSVYVMDLTGRFSNTESAAADRIHSASEDVLEQVSPLDVRSLGRLWWEKGNVSAVWRGGYDAYVLEGRIYTVSTWVAALLGRIRGRRVLLWGHGWKRAEGRLKRTVRRAFYAPVNGLMVYGDRAAELGRSYGVPEGKIQVVYNSLYSASQLRQRPAHSQDDDAGPRRPTLIYSSRLTARHRLDILAEALRDWPGPDQPPRLIVIGEGAERARLQQLFTESGVDATFLGAVYDQEALCDLYAQADLALSIGGAGLNVIQALGFGVPVVAEAGHHDSSPEIEAVQEGQTGRYYSAGSAASLREIIQQLLNDPDQIARLGNNGVEMVRRRYTAERHAEAIERALQFFLRG